MLALPLGALLQLRTSTCFPSFVGPRGPSLGLGPPRDGGQGSLLRSVFSGIGGGGAEEIAGRSDLINHRVPVYSIPPSSLLLLHALASWQPRRSSRRALLSLESCGWLGLQPRGTRRLRSTTAHPPFCSTVLQLGLF